jgi:hypothetical protein
MLKKLTLITAVLGIIGCGTSLDFNGRYEVQNVNILADDISVGESVRTEVFFETKTEADGTPDGVQVVVKVSSALQYLPGTSRIYDDSTDESDLRSPDDVVTCGDGSAFLFYNFLDSELEDRSLSGISNFGLKFEVSGRVKTPAAVISAAAAEDQDFSCTSDFDEEESESVEVK